MEPGVIIGLVVGLIAYEILVFYLARDVFPNDVLYSSETPIIMKMICISIVLPIAIITYWIVVICMTSMTLMAMGLKIMIVIMYMLFGCCLNKEKEELIGKYIFRFAVEEGETAEEP